MPTKPTKAAEHVKQLLCELQTHVNKNSADGAANSLELLNKHLVNWCESTSPPSVDELSVLQTQINMILATAENQKAESFSALLKHKKSDKAINAYKST
ncbi:hypothetical protein [Pseudoalteromonas sp. ND6B]|jgi:hypothetical protein|uniref:hypothetical protein n=1 Tax=Pseudoalteromonas sp. ND6B TaxID=1535421 RepID=UPI00051A4861|nr:hypothetical protein [Pseudoalteromonas sp. ND6B]KGJ98575.1 hypothetical protein ND6B_3114 [Pseudoalteromonas sp. ND6B]